MSDLDEVGEVGQSRQKERQLRTLRSWTVLVQFYVCECVVTDNVESY